MLDEDQITAENPLLINGIIIHFELNATIEYIKFEIEIAASPENCVILNIRLSAEERSHGDFEISTKTKNPQSPRAFWCLVFRKTTFLKPWQTLLR